MIREFLLKIGQYLAKLWVTVGCPVYFILPFMHLAIIKVTVDRNEVISNVFYILCVFVMFLS